MAIFFEPRLNIIDKESTKFNIIENDFENNYNEEENKKYIPQKFSEYQVINGNEKNNNKDENNDMKKRNEDILHFEGTDSISEYYEEHLTATYCTKPCVLDAI